MVWLVTSGTNPVGSMNASNNCKTGPNTSLFFSSQTGASCRASTSTPSFSVIQGCRDSCKQAYNTFQNFQGNIYWRTDGQFANDSACLPSTYDAGTTLEASGQIVLLEPWLSNRTKSIVKSPKLYLADTGLLCALLNIHSQETLSQAPAAGAIWKTFVFAQLRERERRAGRTGGLFFWRDRTREVDFVVDVGGHLELFEAKWTEVPSARDAVNIDFVRNVVGKSRIAGAAIICRTANSFPIAEGLRALPLAELE